MDRTASSKPRVQHLLYPPAEFELHTQVIRRRKDFEGLFEGGFNELKAISYAVTPSVVLDFVRAHGFDKTELLVGENLAEGYRKDLGARGLEAVRELIGLVREGRLRILFPPKTVHTKLYILKGEHRVRVIQTSANFTKTAREASRQTNYAWYADFAPDDATLARIKEDYNQQLEGADLFLGDLIELLKGEDQDDEAAIRNWLSGPSDPVAETVRLVHDAVATTVEAAREDQTMVTLSLPEGRARRTVERVIGASGGHNGSESAIDVQTALTNIQNVVGLPYLTIRAGEVLLAINGKVVPRTAAPAPAAEIDKALDNLEAYCRTPELGQTGDPAAAQMAFYEVVLYVLASPFFHHYMTAYRSALGNVSRRGPRVLYVFGASHNGKSTLLAFALKLLAGVPVQPLPGKQFTKTKVQNARMTSTVFPLAFDDVPFASQSTAEEIVKSYWEVWWDAQRPSAQIVLTSNNPRLREWAQSRMKRIDLYVHFPPRPAAQCPPLRAHRVREPHLRMVLLPLPAAMGRYGVAGR